MRQGPETARRSYHEFSGSSHLETTSIKREPDQDITKDTETLLEEIDETLSQAAPPKSPSPPEDRGEEYPHIEEVPDPIVIEDETAKGLRGVKTKVGGFAMDVLNSSPTEDEATWTAYS